MSSIKVVIRKKLNKDGSYPLALRITRNRKTSFIHLGYNVKEKDWDNDAQRVKKSHANSTRLNNLIAAKVAEASDKSLEMETQRKDVSSVAVKHRIKPQAGTSFANQAQLYLDRLKETGKYNRYNSDKPRVKHFKEFLTGGDISFSEVTAGLLNRFKVYLKGTYNVSDRTIMNHLVVIRSVFSQAIKENVTEQKYYPFGKGGITIKFPETTKVGLTQEDVNKLENVELTELTQDHARNLWLISYYFAGMRISDVLRLRWSDFQDFRLHYTMGKNNKAGSLKTPEKAMRILTKYTGEKKKDDDLIFPDLKSLPDLEDSFVVQRRIATSVNRCDRILREEVADKAKIKGKLSMHIARHTFATIAADKIPIQMLQKLYRHSSITTTIGYQANFVHKDADSALDAVLGN